MRDTDTVVKTVTVDVDETGSYTIEDLPKYNADGSKAQYGIVETGAGYYEPSYEMYGMGESPDGFIVKFSNDTVITNGYVNVYPIRNSFYTPGRIIDRYGGSSFAGSSYLIWSDYLNATTGSLLNNRYVYIPNMSENRDDCGFMIYASSADKTRNRIAIDSVTPVYGDLDQYGHLGEYLKDHYFVNGDIYLDKNSMPPFYNAVEINGRVGTGENLLNLSNSYMLYRWNADADNYNYQTDVTKLIRPRAYRIRNTYEPKRLRGRKGMG